ncbi:MAG: TetR/AcrR family transcriptional regulator [Brevundimonas sp.]|nr:MAG: TetR/AcrR family transcriptional regulator [Brevundimonas sp.]
MSESPPAPRDRAPRDRTGTQRRIVDAGEVLLLRDGFPGLNVQTLAAEARCDRKLVYRYFEGTDGVVAKLAARALAELLRTLDAAPNTAGESQRAFARESLTAWLAALRASPLSLRLMAWALVEDTALNRRIEAERAALLQAWMRERRPRLRTAPEGDAVALNAVLLGAVQQLALAEPSLAQVGGVTLDDAGFARIQTALDALLAVFPD